MNYIYLLIAAAILIGIGVIAMSTLKDESKITPANIDSISSDSLEIESKLRIEYQNNVNGEKQELEFAVEWPELENDVDIKEFSHGLFVLRPLILNSRMLDEAEQRWLSEPCQAVYIKLPSREWRASGFLIRSNGGVEPEQEARSLLKEAFDGLPVNGS